MRAAQRPAPQGWPRGDGDGLLADGHAPVECGAHRVPPERRQRHAARVEPAGTRPDPSDTNSTPHM